MPPPCSTIRSNWIEAGIDPLAVGDGTQLLQIDDAYRIGDQSGVRPGRVDGFGHRQFLVRRNFKQAGDGLFGRHLILTAGQCQHGQQQRSQFPQHHEPRSSRPNMVRSISWMR